MSATKHIIKGLWNPIGATKDVINDPNMGKTAKALTIAYIAGCHREETEEEIREEEEWRRRRGITRPEPLSEEEQKKNSEEAIRNMKGIAWFIFIFAFLLPGIALWIQG